MKQLFYIIFIIPLLATSCNASHKPTDQTQPGVLDKAVGTSSVQEERSVMDSALVPPSTSQSDNAPGFLTRFTASIWQTIEPSGEGYSYEFSSNGDVTRNVISDYTDEDKGRWGYKELSHSEGLLFFLWPSKFPDNNASAKEEEVTYFRVNDNNELKIIGGMLTAVKPLGVNPAPKQLNEPPAIFSEKNFPDYFKIISHSWEGINLKNDRFMPDFYLFRQNGTFIARYRNGACQHEGYWSLNESQVFLEMPPDHCDARGYNKAVTVGRIYKFENGFLVLNQEYRYRPAQ